MKQFLDNLRHYRQLLRCRPYPLKAKLFLAAAILYLISPIDLIPDFIPVIGWLDDLIIVPWLFKQAMNCIEEAR